MHRQSARRYSPKHMSLCVSFPKHDALSSGDLTSIRLELGRDSRVGREDCESGDVTVVFSGSLTAAPPPHCAGIGASAARTLAALYHEHGSSALSRIDGAFCAVILDRRRSSILLARDKLGIARAYLCRTGESITFADCMADLLAAQDRRFSVDIDSIYAFLMIGWVPTPHSMFREIEKLPAGTVVEFRDGKSQTTRYYDVPHDPTRIAHRSRQDLSNAVAEHLDRSVARGLALGERWGSFLSGGVDSSSVVTSICEEGESNFPTYFGGFAPQLNRYLPNPEEPEMSRLVATLCGTDHQMLWLGPEAVDKTAAIVEVLEEPVCDGGCIVVGAVMDAARGRLNGIMTGVGVTSSSRASGDTRCSHCFDICDLSRDPFGASRQP